jgi:hypothetical protein
MIVGGNDNEDGDFRSVPRDSKEDEFYSALGPFIEGVENVYAYHLDKPRKWRIIGQKPYGWSREKKYHKLNVILQFPEVQ